MWGGGAEKGEEKEEIKRRKVNKWVKKDVERREVHKEAKMSFFGNISLERANHQAEQRNLWEEHR